MQEADDIRKRTLHELKEAKAQVSSIEHCNETESAWQQYITEYANAGAHVTALKDELKRLLAEHPHVFYRHFIATIKQKLPRELRDKIYDYIVHDHEHMVKVHRPDCSCWSCKAFPGPRAIQNLPLWLCDPVYTGKEDATKSNLRVEIAEAFFRNAAGDADGSSRPESVFRGQLRDGPWSLVLCFQVSRHADGFTTRYTSQKYRNEHHSHVSLMRRAAKAALALTEGA